MPLSHEANNVLYSGSDGLTLAEQLQDAYDRNVQNGLVGHAPDLLATVASAAVEQSTAPDSRPALANLDPGFHSAIEASLVSTTKLLSRIDVETPSLHEFAYKVVGVETLERLKNAYEVMKNLNLEPEIIFAPLLDYEQWQELYKSLQNDPIVNKDKKIKNSGLLVDHEIIDQWDDLQGNDGHFLDINGAPWHLLVLPGTNKSPNVNLNYDGIDENDDLSTDLDAQAVALSLDIDKVAAYEYLHPSIAAYLTLQANRLQNDQSPIDFNVNTWDGTNTWLGGMYEVDENLRAPRGRWDQRYGQVLLNQSGVDQHYNSVGVRLPVWA